MTSGLQAILLPLAPCPLLLSTRPLLLFNELCLAVRAFLWQVVEELVVAEVVVAFFIGTYATLAELVGDAFALCRQLAGIDERLDSEEQRCEERQSVEDGRYGAEVAIAPEDETYGNGTHGEDGGSAGRHTEDMAVNFTMILDELVHLQACIDVSAGRADCNMNVLILVVIEEVLNLVSGGTTLASPPVEGNTDFSGNDKLIFHCLLLQILRQR